MTSYKTIVRGLIKSYISDYMVHHYLGFVSGIRIDSLTISGSICFFEARAAVEIVKKRRFILKGEVFSSMAIDISCVEEKE